VIDTDQLLAGTDLRALIAADLGEPDDAGNWHCPFHDDARPSFGIVKGRPHLWHCFGCGLSGDAIAYIRARRGLGFRAACERLAGGRTLPQAPAVRRVASARPVPAVRQSEAPSGRWAQRALAVAWGAAEDLWSPAGRRGRDYLRARGIGEDTARHFRLGWIGRDLRDPSEEWGLPDGGKTVWTPAGIVLPWFVEGDCWRINVRRLEPGHGPKYCGPSGWTQALFNADAVTHDRPAVLCEGELDAVTVHQAAGDLCAPVATGSTGVARWLYLLAVCPRVLVAFDADTGGDDAARWWTGKLPNARRLRPRDAKDPAAMDPAVLRAQIAEALGIPSAGPPPFPLDWTDRLTDEELERLAVRTADGTMTDAEALEAEGLTPRVLPPRQGASF
jgi:DNA primase